MKLETVEDYLEVLAGLQGNDKIKIESVDCTILYSIARQVFKGKAFTDRQLDVVCMKLNYYNDQFNKLGYLNLQYVIKMQTTRNPLRNVDRSQWIKVVDAPPMVQTVYTLGRRKPSNNNEVTKNSHIAIRFPFSKRTIQSVEMIAHKHKMGYYHEKGTHIHYFKITENAVCDIIEEKFLMKHSH